MDGPRQDALARSCLAEEQDRRIDGRELPGLVARRRPWPDCGQSGRSACPGTARHRASVGLPRRLSRGRRAPSRSEQGRGGSSTTKLTRPIRREGGARRDQEAPPVAHGVFSLDRVPACRGLLDDGPVKASPARAALGIGWALGIEMPAEQVVGGPVGHQERPARTQEAETVRRAVHHRLQEVRISVSEHRRPEGIGSVVCGHVRDTHHPAPAPGRPSRRASFVNPPRAIADRVPPLLACERPCSSPG